MTTITEEPQSSSTQIALFEQAAGFPGGSVHPVGIDLVDPALTFDEWKRIGWAIDVVDDWTNWAIGDWYVAGESLFGESEASSVVGGTSSEQQDLANRISRLSPATVVNYARVARGIKKEQRRADLKFSTHEPVVRLDPEEQEKWLQRAADEGLGREQLRRLILDSKRKPSDPVDPPADPPSDPEPSLCELATAACQAVIDNSNVTSDGDFIVSAAAVEQCRQVLGF